MKNSDIKGVWIVVLTAGYDIPEAYGPFKSEDECYEFAAKISVEPNDWTPLKLKDPKETSA